MTMKLFDEMQKKTNYIYLQYTPFLLLYFCIAGYLHGDAFTGDEGRYFQFAENLLNGFYSPTPPDINLWNGPGYPIFLMPFVYFGLPLIVVTLFNAAFQYLSIAFLHLSLREYVSNRLATLIGVAWGCYYISYQELGSMLTEPFSLCLISLFVYAFVRAHSAEGKKWRVIGGMVLGYLALTKIIFGYVILVGLVLIGVYQLIQIYLKSKVKSPILVILGIALVVNLPYLTYTHSLTGKLLYWGNSGGMSLYWMSTPFEGEYGDWNNATFTANCHNTRISCNADLLAQNHQKDMDYILSLPKNKRDDAYKDLALQNIRNHPVKYARNVLSNVSRLFFGLPITYYPQRDTTILRFPPNILLLSVMFLGLVIWLMNVRHIPIEISFLVLLTLVYLGGTSLLSAYPRMLYVVVPMILFWSGVILEKAIRISFKIK